MLNIQLMQIMHVHYIHAISLSTIVLIVLNSKDQPEKQWHPQFKHI